MSQFRCCLWRARKLSEFIKSILIFVSFLGEPSLEALLIPHGYIYHGIIRSLLNRHCTIYTIIPPWPAVILTTVGLFKPWAIETPCALCLQHSSDLCNVSSGFIDILVFCHTSFIGTETAAAEESTAAMWNPQRLQPTTQPQDCQRHGSRLLQILYTHTVFDVTVFQFEFYSN